jgi:RNA-directed DNA polymerase
MSRDGLFSKQFVSVRYLASVVGHPPAELRRIANDAENLYAPFTKTQVRNGRTKHRVIDNPQGALKDIQASIKARLLDKVPMPTFMFGGIKGRSAKHNAEVHVGQPEVVNIDLKNFFPSIRSEQVASVWKNHFEAYGEVVWLLTRLTTRRNYLPQGSPASMSLANLVLLPVVEDLQTLCEARGLRISTYVDDVTISGADVRSSLNQIILAFTKGGFRLARNKLRVLPNSDCQVVTGYVVNRHVSVSRDRRESIRKELCGLQGRRITETESSRVRGLIANVAVACPRQAQPLRALLARLESAPV